MPLKIIGKTDKGLRRSRNEDAFLIMESIGLCSVADGMGGHYGGNIASSIAVQIISENFSEKYNPDDGNGGEILSFLVDTISKGNIEIYDRNKQDMFPSGMGTTLVALLIKEPKVFLGFVGDSRIYLYRDKKLCQISDDHSLVAELIRNGIISKDEAMYHQNKNIITRALGMNEDVQVDGKVIDLEEGDLFLLCSDGLSDLVSDDEVEAILEQTSGNLETCAEHLIDYANNAGGFDNITVVLALYSKDVVPSNNPESPKSSCFIEEETATIDLETLQEAAIEMNQELSPNTNKNPSSQPPVVEINSGFESDPEMEDTRDFTEEELGKVNSVDEIVAIEPEESPEERAKEEEAASKKTPRMIITPDSLLETIDPEETKERLPPPLSTTEKSKEETDPKKEQ